MNSIGFTLEDRKPVKRIAELPLHDRKTILKMIDAMADARRKAS